MLRGLGLRRKKRQTIYDRVHNTHLRWYNGLVIPKTANSVIKNFRIWVYSSHNAPPTRNLVIPIHSRIGKLQGIPLPTTPNPRNWHAPGKLKPDWRRLTPEKKKETKAHRIQITFLRESPSTGQRQYQPHTKPREPSWRIQQTLPTTTFKNHLKSILSTTPTTVKLSSITVQPNIPRVLCCPQHPIILLYTNYTTTAMLSTCSSVFTRTHCSDIPSVTALYARDLVQHQLLYTLLGDY